MKLTKAAEKTLEKYKDRLELDLANKNKSIILSKFSEVFPEVSSKIPTDKIKLMDLWLKAHVDRYFAKIKDFDPQDWEKDATVYIPIHGHVHLKPELQYLLNIPILRRCNAIKQLSTAYTIYPGAKHTRDEHQLGTLFIMQKFCEHLTKEGAISEDDVLTLEVAALIHDVAHPPLGHSLDTIKEILIPPNEEKISYSYDRKIDKTLLEIYLTDQNYQLQHAIESIDTVNFNLLKSILFNKSNDDFPIAYGDLLDSEIDADRLDYLLRDGIHTGKLKSIDVNHIIEHSHFCNIKDNGKTRRSLAFSEDIVDDLNMFLTERKNMYKQVYEIDEKVILDEVLVHGIFGTLKGHYGLEKNDTTGKFLLLTDCELNEFLELFSPSSMYNQIYSQLNGEAQYILLNKYNLRDKNNPELHKALKEAIITYSKLYGFLSKINDEKEFSDFAGIKVEDLEIPPILFSLPHYIPSDDDVYENYEREGKRKRGLNELVLTKSDGSCGYFTDLSTIQKEKDPSLNKFILIGNKKYTNKLDYSITEKFEEWILSKFGPKIDS